MYVEMRICCASSKQEKCKNVESIIRKKFGDEFVAKNDGLFEHVINARYETHNDIEEDMTYLRNNAKGQIALIEYNVLHK